MVPVTAKRSSARLRASEPDKGGGGAVMEVEDPSDSSMNGIARAVNAALSDMMKVSNKWKILDSSR